MATKRQFVSHTLGGGWATDFGPVAPVGADQSGRVSIPFLVEAENCFYELDGGPHKIGGSTNVNSTALESGADIRGIFDLWLMGTSGSPTQHRITHVGTTIKKDDADGTFTNLFTGLETGKNPSYMVMEDLLIMASDSTVDVPKSWDGTTAQNLAGTPPNFAFAVEHKNRAWASGDVAKPSRLYYSALLDGADWIGAGSGTIDISPDDGDRITGLISHKNELWVFKGPYHGSIHRIAGSSPTGADSFARDTFIEGLGSVNHNSIFRFRDDIGFMWSDGSVHSLKATASFGDFSAGALSAGHHEWNDQHVNLTALNTAQAVNSPRNGYVLFAVPIDGSTVPSIILMMDYRFDPVRWSTWPAYASVSLASVIDASNSNRHKMAAGTTDGFVTFIGQVARNISGNAISYKWTTPFVDYGSPIQRKYISIAALSFQPRGAGNITFGWGRDGNTMQTHSIAQGGSSTLGTFVLGTSVLGGAALANKFMELEEGGEFGAIQYQVTNSTVDDDVEVHGFSVALSSGSWSTEG